MLKIKIYAICMKFNILNENSCQIKLADVKNIMLRKLN